MARTSPYVWVVTIAWQDGPSIRATAAGVFKSSKSAREYVDRLVDKGNPPHRIFIDQKKLKP